ncbi:MAG: hypothetical protein Fur0020_07730 [Thermodesulfovibrionia bacterium]
MQDERLFHDWIIAHMRQRLSRDYKEIRINLEGERKNEFKGLYPDLILGNHGMVLSVMEVETEGSLTDKKAEEWKALSGLGVKLIIMVPKASRAKTLELLWRLGIADRVSVGTYEININMP